MTKDLNQENNDSSNKQETEQKQKKESLGFLTKLRRFLAKILLIVILVFSGYYGFQLWKVKSAEKNTAKLKVEKYDNVDSEIFDLSQDAKMEDFGDEFGDDGHFDEKNHNHDKSGNLLDMTPDELEEKGSEFIYQTLLKNQIQINHLSEEIYSLREEIAVYKNRERIGQLVFAYIDLRQKIYGSEDYYEELRNFEILASFDENLERKISQIKSLIPLFIGQEKLIENFDNLIPQLIAAKTHDPEAGFVAKIRHNISKLVTIRKVGESSDKDSVDSTIVGIENALKLRDYDKAILLFDHFDEKHKKILTSFANDLKIAADLKKIDQEILNYLKGLS